MKKIINNQYGLAIFSLICLFVIFALFFATKQNLWVDETTQLSGLTLPPIDLYLWLGGFLEHPFLVPPDRMPVLSYWVGKVWVFLTNSEVITLRWLSVLLVTVAVCVLSRYLLVQKMYTTALASLVFICLSPNLVVFAVEIRAYALFFLIATIAAVLYLDTIRTLEKEGDVSSTLICLAIALGLAINTHLFGLLLTGSIIGAYIVLALLDKRFRLSGKLVLYISFILGLAALVVTPSILGSFGITPSNVVPDSFMTDISAAVKLIYRLVSHQTMLEIYFFPILALLVFYSVILLSLFKKVGLQKTAIILVLLIGLSTAFLAKVLLTGFNPLSIHYNIWMFPFLAILFGMSVTDLNSQKQQNIVLLLLFGLFAYGQYNLLISGEKYAHTRSSEIEKRAVAYSKEAPVAIIYNKEMAKTWFAGIFKLKGDVNQYIPSEKGYENLMTGGQVSQAKIESDHGVLLSVYGQNILSKDLVKLDSRSAMPVNSLAYKQIVLSKPLWRKVEAVRFNAHESADILVYIRN